jgi:hypothetical protein
VLLSCNASLVTNNMQHGCNPSSFTCIVRVDNVQVGTVESANKLPFFADAGHPDQLGGEASGPLSSS